MSYRQVEVDARRRNETRAAGICENNGGSDDKILDAARQIGYRCRGAVHLRACGNTSVSAVGASLSDENTRIRIGVGIRIFQHIENITTRSRRGKRHHEIFAVDVNLVVARRTFPLHLGLLVIIAEAATRQARFGERGRRRQYERRFASRSQNATDRTHIDVERRTLYPAVNNGNGSGNGNKILHAARQTDIVDNRGTADIGSRSRTGRARVGATRRDENARRIAARAGNADRDALVRRRRVRKNIVVAVHKGRAAGIRTAEVVAAAAGRQAGVIVRQRNNRVGIGAGRTDGAVCARADD